MTLPELPSFNAADDQVVADGWPTGTVWHYTTGAGLGGLIEGKVLWASAMAFMNDVHELKTGQDIIQKLLDTHGDDVDKHIRSNFTDMVRSASQVDPNRTYVACASRQPDSLTMWRNYAGEVGYAVALDGNKPLSMRRQRPLTEGMIGAMGFLGDEARRPVHDRATAGSPQFEWEPVVYEPEKQYRSAWPAFLGIEAIALARAADTDTDKGELDVMVDLARLLPAFKNPAFVDEAETRIVCRPAPHVDLMYLKHRPGKYGMVPYVELGFPKHPARETAVGPEPMEDLPIKGVVIGPTRYPDEACMGVRELLRSHGYNESISVIPSRIPFRP